MKFTLTKFLVIFVGIYLLIKFMPAIPLSSVITQKTDLFTVTGEGKVTVVPDTAIVNLGINTTKPTVKDAQGQANTVIKNINSALKNLQIEDKDIRTSDYTIYPQYDYANGGSRITGYAVNASVSVTVRNIDKINNVIDSATAAGANNVSDIQFTVDEVQQKDLLRQARIKAIAEAKSKAADLSSETGMTLGRIVNIQESAPVPPRVFTMEATPATQIQPGSTDIVSTVTLSYETR